jgi:hypothetical protein
MSEQALAPVELPDPETSKRKLRKVTKPSKTKPRDPIPTATEILGEDYRFGNTLDGIVAACGEAVVVTLFNIAAKQQLADYIRLCCTPTRKRQPMSREELKAAVENWRPSIKHRGQTTVQKAMKFVDTMTPEEREELHRLLVQT